MYVRTSIKPRARPGAPAIRLNRAARQMLRSMVDRPEVQARIAESIREATHKAVVQGDGIGYPPLGVRCRTR